MKNIVYYIQNMCKEIRRDRLKLSTQQFADLVGEKKSNISAFENHRANKIEYLLYYIKYSDNKTLTELIINIINEVRK